MKIDRLQLIAFGPFTETVLDLSGGREGFHLIYGDNEAGKSSALRALRHLLYGIPTRSNDNFIHSHTKMRIGATLRSATGDILEFIRRKGRINTLRGPDDMSLVEESRLQAFMGNIDAGLFDVMFGIGYEDLVRGGQDIVQGGGDVGRLVFSAGTGIANLMEIQNDLQAEADRLFRPAGQKQIINESLTRLNQIRVELKAAQLKGQDWVNHDKALRKAEMRINKVQAELDTYKKTLSRLQRIQQSLPLVAERKDLENELKGYTDARVLPESFPEQRRELVSKMAAAQSQKEQSLKNIESNNQAISKLVITSGLLDNADIIENIHLELGSQNKAARDRIQLETRQSGLLAEATEILKNLGDNRSLEDAEKLRIKKSEAQKIRKLGSEYERIITRMENARERLPEINREIFQIEDELNSCPPSRAIDLLQIAVADAEEYSPQEKQLRSEQAEIQSALETIELEQTRLGLKEKSFKEIESLPVPSLETLHIFEKNFDTNQRQTDAIQSELKKNQNALAKIERQIEKQRLEQEVPTEEDLLHARALRNTGWGLIAKKLNQETLSNEKIQAYLEKTPDSSNLVDAFDENLRQADAIADRLRREADRVATKARLLAEQTALEDQSVKLNRELEKAEKEKHLLSQQWDDLWKPLGINHRSPKEMISWYNNFRMLIEKMHHLRNQRVKNDSLQQNIHAHRFKLIKYLGDFGIELNGSDESLNVLIKKARSVATFEENLLRKQEQLYRDKKKLEIELKAAQNRLKSSENQLNQWQVQWAEAVRFIGLDENALPDEANVVMDEIRSLFEKLKEAGILQKRIMGIDRDADNFVKNVNGIVEVVAPDLSGRPASEAALELHHRLKQSRENQTKKETLEKQLAQERQRLRLANDKISELKSQLETMCDEAGCQDIDQLPEAERRGMKKRELHFRLESNDEQLRRLSGGVSVADFIRETQNVDPDSIAGEIQVLEEAIDMLNTEKDELYETRGREKKELSLMDGSSKAAELAEQIQTILGGIENNAEQYVRLKIATKVLSMAIERYREKSQGPVLKRASTLFNQITNGTFESIRADYDDKGQPVIVGIRQHENEMVRVENMSDGTADQLYLALRLAGLEMYLENNEPLPFIVDDILIKFDNDRAASTLQALAEISKKTQLIFFTHHHHLVELANSQIDPSVLFHHNL